MKDEEILENLVRQFKTQGKSNEEILYYIVNVLMVIFYELSLEDL